MQEFLISFYWFSRELIPDVKQKLNYVITATISSNSKVLSYNLELLQSPDVDNL